MSVKTIFKVIIGTMVLMITSFFMIEYYNISVASPKLKTLTQVALRQSCQYFAQETYKEDSGNAYQLIGRDGALDTGLNGMFYANNAEATYDRLYRNSSDFKAFALENAGYWRNLKLIAEGMGISTGLTMNAGEDELAKYYVEDMLTPLNMGVAYLDRETVEDIFRWELVNILMNGRNDMLEPYGEDKAYVFYEGFRVYYDSIKITDIEYKVYDLYNGDDAEEFQLLTNIDVEDYLNKSMIAQSDERRYVTIAKLDYSMRVGYEGITPIKRAMQWAFKTESNHNSEVDVFDGITSRSADSWVDNVKEDTSLSKAGKRNDDAVRNEGDNFSNQVGHDLDNTIIYYIVR